MERSDPGYHSFTSSDQAYDWAMGYFLAHYHKGVAKWLILAIAVSVGTFCGAMLAALLPDASSDNSRFCLGLACVAGLLACLTLFSYRQFLRKAGAFATEAISAYSETITPDQIRREFELHVVLERIIRPPWRKP